MAIIRACQHSRSLASPWIAQKCRIGGMHGQQGMSSTTSTIPDQKTSCLCFVHHPQQPDTKTLHLCNEKGKLERSWYTYLCNAVLKIILIRQVAGWRNGLWRCPPNSEVDPQPGCSRDYSATVRGSESTEISQCTEISILRYLKDHSEPHNDLVHDRNNQTVQT